MSEPNPATEKVTGYNVYRSKSSGGGYVKLNANPVTTPFYQDTVTYNGKTYFYIVRAVKAGEESADSNEVAYEAIPSMLRLPVRLSTRRVLFLLLLLLFLSLFPLVIWYKSLGRVR